MKKHEFKMVKEFSKMNQLDIGPGHLRHDAEAAAGVQDQGAEAQGVLQLRRG